MDANSTRTTSSSIRTIPCPTCRKPAAVAAEDFPFCSERCRLLDLGKWANGDYRISSPVLDPDLLEDIESGRLRGDEDR